MARVALSAEQKRAYKLKNFKGWVHKQMKLSGMNQTDLGKALGVSQVRVSQMLKVPDPKNKSRADPDPFSYGDLLIMFDLFGTPEEERKRLLTL